MDTERQVAGYYTHGSLQQAIFDALRSMGKDPEHLTTTDYHGRRRVPSRLAPGDRRAGG